MEAPAAEETAAEEPAAGKTGAAESIQVYVGTNSDRYWSDDDTSRLLVESEWPALALDSDCEANYPGLAAAFRELNQATEETARETFQQYKEGIDEFLKDHPDSEVSYSELQECYVVRADADYVSFLDIIAGYAGGAHGYYGYKGVTLRPGTGETVKLSDLVADGPAFLAEVRKTVEEEYPEVRLARMPENLGFSGGVNEGIRRTARGRKDVRRLYLARVLSAGAQRLFLVRHESGSELCASA